MNIAPASEMQPYPKAENVRELKRESKYLYDSVKLFTRAPGINGYHVLQELEHRLRSDLDELACDPTHVYKATFAEQAEAAAKRLKDNVPGSICPALTLVNKPVAVPQPNKVPAVEKVTPTTDLSGSTQEELHRTRRRRGLRRKAIQTARLRQRKGALQSWLAEV
jgi:hypothetical protein